MTSPAESWSTSAASIELVAPSQLTSPVAGPAAVGEGLAVLAGGGGFVGDGVAGGGVFVGVGVWAWGGVFGGVSVGVAVGAGAGVFVGGGDCVAVGGGVLVGAGVGVAGEPAPLKVALTERSPFIVTNVILPELSSVPVHDSQA